MKDTLRSNLAVRLGVGKWLKVAFRKRDFKKFVNGKCGINMSLKTDDDEIDEDPTEDEDFGESN